MQNKQPTILVAWPFSKSQVEKMNKGATPDYNLHYRPCQNPLEVEELLDPTVEVIYTYFVPADFRKAPGIKWLQLHSAGIDQLWGNPVLESDVTITTTSGIHATSVGEYVMGTALALTRHIPEMVRNQLKHYWPENRWTYYMGSEIRDSTFCIIGYGSIGREIARQAHMLGARVLAVKGNPDDRTDRGYTLPGIGDPEGQIPERLYSPDELDRALPDSDYVVVAAPLTEKTRGMIGEAELSVMRSSAYLINIARGEIVEEQALLRALSDAWIAGAALDVFPQEPLPGDHPLWDLDNVIISPHVAGATTQYEERASDLFVQNLIRYREGQELLNRFDRDRGY